MTSDRHRIEGRGVWHRPTESTLDEIQHLLDSLAEAGFNQVYLETYFNGKVIFPPYGLLAGWYMDHSYGMYGRDYFRAFLAEASLRSLRVFAWIEIFMVSELGESRDVPVVLQAHPDWINVNRDGSTLTRYEGGNYLFLDPARPEVHSHICSITEYIRINYPEISGFNIDYIRYPVARDGDDNGYSPFAIENFAQQQALRISSREQMVASLDRDPSLRRLWTVYKTEAVSTMVREIRRLIQSSSGKCSGPEPLLTTSVFPQSPSSHDFLHMTDQDIMELGTKCQFWNSWLNEGLIDVVMPMIYHDDIELVTRQSSDFMKTVAGRSLVYIGLIPTFHYPSRDEREKHAENYRLQIEAAIAAGADGSAMFASGQIAFHPRSIAVLRSSVYRQPAWAPDEYLTLSKDARQFSSPGYQSQTAGSRETKPCMKIHGARNCWGTPDGTWPRHSR